MTRPFNVTITVNRTIDTFGLEAENHADAIAAGLDRWQEKGLELEPGSRLWVYCEPRP